jgi:chloramphenicol 3-O-phosphotransferase
VTLKIGHSGCMTPSPRVVILNGPSSSGKTTLATAFRDQRAASGELWFLTGIDDFLAKLPSEWLSVGPESGPYAADGVRFERTDRGLEFRIGSEGRKLIRAYQSGVAAAAGAGLNVIVDEVVIDQASWDDWTTSLVGLHVVWVGVRCSLDVANSENSLGPNDSAARREARPPSSTDLPNTTSR